MSELGRSIRIYLADGSPTGIRHAEIVNWTGQAIACPRGRCWELSGWTESGRPGVYFLILPDAGLDQGRVYVGESENVFLRVKDHIAKKEFWTELVAFTNKDENLTKGHVRYLESRLISLARSASRIQLDNGNETQNVPLPRGDKDAMDEFVANLRTILGTLGYRFFEPLQPHAASMMTSTGVPLFDDESHELQFAFKNLIARGIRTDEGFVVLATSQVAEPVTSMQIMRS